MRFKVAERCKRINRTAENRGDICNWRNDLFYQLDIPFDRGKDSQDVLVIFSKSFTFKIIS